MNTKNKVLMSVVATVSLLVVASGGVVRAQEFQQCGGDNPASSMLSLPVGQYDVYAKLGQKDTSENAVLYTQVLPAGDEQTECKTLGSAAVNDKTYTNVTSVNVTKQEIVLYYLSSLSSTSMQSAAAPQIVFVNKENVVCDFTHDCIVAYHGAQFKLTPQKISLNSDSLRAGSLLAYKDDTVKKVVYTIDGKPAYEKPTLQPFDERYVSGGAHVLGRTVLLRSGQALNDSRILEKGTTTDINYTFVAFYMSQSTTVTIIVTLTGLFVLWALVLTIVRKIQQKRVWKQTHIAGYGPKFDPLKVGAQKNFYDESVSRTLYRYRKWWMSLISIAALVLVCMSYIVGTFTVDGVSMLPTLHDRSVHLLVKVQSTLSKVNGSEYVPKLGTIVVVQKDDNNLFDPIAAAEKHYVVKRVVGLPGERVTVKSGKILIYNDQYKEGFEPDASFKWTHLLLGSEQFNIDITLKDSELFVVGDNRDESIDSRFYGPINTSQVIGSVVP